LRARRPEFAQGAHRKGTVSQYPVTGKLERGRGGFE
jgi:hypothetical protein